MDYDCWKFHYRNMKILIIKLSAIGDVVQTLPALEAIKKTFPDSEITWVVEEAAAGILEGHPLINRLLVSHRRAWLRLLKNPFTAVQGLRFITGFVRNLRSIRYDIAIDFQGLFKSGILMGFACAERKIGFDRTREFSYLFLNERLPAYDIEKHALERYLDIARYLGAKDVSPACALPIEKEQEIISQRIDAVKPPGRRLVVMNPGARWTTKLWPERNFAELADLLILEKNALVIFTGGPDDRRMIERVVTLMKHGEVENWAGKTTLKEVAALASISDLFITTDTGSMHLAAAVGAKVLALFGPTAPWRTGPYGSSNRVVRSGIDCSPCFQRSCGKNVKCMTGITVADVMKKLPL
jgi:heptosyltransferase I